MPDSYQLDQRTVRRLGDVLAWAERQMYGRPPGEPPNRPFPIATLWRFGRTCADPQGGTYPKPSERPNTFWIQWEKEEYEIDDGQGRQTRVETELSDVPTPKQDYPSGYTLAHCYTDTTPATKTYVPEGTLVLVANHNGLWWFQYRREEFWGRITAREVVATNQWKYTFEEVYKSDAGYGQWLAVQSGRTGYCFNGVEDPNDGAGEEGNGASGTLLPVGIGAVVEVHEEYYDAESGGTKEYWFQFENQDHDDASDYSDYSDSDSSTTIDVVICDPWNRCGNYIVFPQRRLHLPRGTTIEVLPDTVVPIYECQSSESSFTSDSTPPPDPSDSSAEAYPDTITVAGQSTTLAPADAEGQYMRAGTHEGKPFYKKGAWLLYYTPVLGCWRIYGGDPGAYWAKYTDLNSPLGGYQPAAGASETAVATEP